jgi:hypothetical protein
MHSSSFLHKPWLGYRSVALIVQIRRNATRYSLSIFPINENAINRPKNIFSRHFANILLQEASKRKLDLTDQFISFNDANLEQNNHHFLGFLFNKPHPGNKIVNQMSAIEK